jgi:hypothetical protein
MGYRKTPLANDEFYHIFNRGVDKRDIFTDTGDLDRFLQSMQEFNSVTPIGSIYEHSFAKNKEEKEPLVSVVCYCLNPNHYHFILKQNIDDGISAFMKSVAGGYTKYFNNRYRRSGSLFQGPYQAVHIEDNEQLLYVSTYVNLNDRVHQLGNPVSKLIRSSWREYTESVSPDICDKDILLGQFRDKDEYKAFALASLGDLIDKKRRDKEIEELLLGI